MSSMTLVRQVSSDGGLGIVRTTAAGAAIEVNDAGLGPITAALCSRTLEQLTTLQPPAICS